MRKIIAAYFRSEQNASMASEEEYWAGLRIFMEEAYPSNAPRPEYEAVLNVSSGSRHAWGEKIFQTPLL